jgi:hypothetical protein
MGLFNKNRDDEEHTDSGVRTVHPAKETRRTPLPQAPSTAHEATLLGSPPMPPPPPPAEPAIARFGIDEAVSLLKQIPSRDNDAVRKAVHKTLEVMQVDRGRLIEDAANKDAHLESRIDKLRAEVDRHNALALAATKEIAALESERTELAATKSWLVEEYLEPISAPILLDRISRPLPPPRG